MSFLIMPGIIIGFVIAQFFSGKKEGVQGRIKSLKIVVGKYFIHLHHWLLFLIILSILIILNYDNTFVYGIVIGIIFQGLTYSDFYKIIYRKNK